MCLYVNKEMFKIEIAQEDIVVYKVFLKRNDTIFSPYQKFVYEIGKEYKTRIKPQFHIHYCEVIEGFHSFLNKKDAKYEMARLQVHDYAWYCCFRCVIPKGSHIVYGTYGSKDSVVSEAIKVVEEV